MDKQDVSFSFGKNWQIFLKSLDEDRLRIAAESLTQFLNMESLRGKTFLDVGCGSGLFSYAAHNLGATRVVSFDVDPMSVQCCKYLRERAGNPPEWEVFEGSILDNELILQLDRFDIVYSWGVLHHTGKMWEAMENSVKLVNQGGYLYLAIYNKILSRSDKSSWIHSFWLSVKKIYNSHPMIAKSVLLPLAMSAYLAMVIARGENPISHVRNYKSHRGMSWSTDATDWLGGYPYEFASVEEVFKFIRERYPKFTLVNLKVTSGRGLNWYLFKSTQHGGDHDS